MTTARAAEATVLPDSWRLNTITPIVSLRVDQSKVEIVKKGMELHTPFELTWSCYTENEKACGVCDSCRLRLKGFRENGIEDPIEYMNQ